MRTTTTSIQRPLPVAPVETQPIWYGLHESVDSCVICGTWEDLQTLLQQGARLVTTFISQEQAETWLNTNPEVYAPIAAGGGPPRTIAVPETNPTKRDDHQVSLHGMVDTRFQGEDPSQGDEERIYGILYDDNEVMDAGLSPHDMLAQDRTGFLGQAIDIAALPGMYAVTLDVESEMASAMVATTLGRSDTGHDLMWRLAKKNALSQIKTREDLFKFVDKVDKVSDRAFKAQDSRLRNFMYARHYAKVHIDFYLQTGLLPRLLRSSFDSYTRLLGKLRQYAFDHRDTLWEGSLAHTMLEYHTMELLNVRLHAPNYRGLILGVYVYLREAQRKGFHHESMNASLWHRLEGSTVESTTMNKVEPGNIKMAKCGHCRRDDLHLGGKARCPAKELEAKDARVAVRAPLNLRQAQAVAKDIKARLAEHPDADVSIVIKAAREVHG
jgi:hypothetical protein